MLNSCSQPKTPKRSRLPQRWLAVAILLFGQWAFATHVHDANEAPGHECTVCHQLHSVKNTAGSSAPFSLLQDESSLPDYLAGRGPVLKARRYLPPSRAPPSN